ncbi:hypothetical protein ABID22_001421 [Pontibacter aydingkolensis]|uniref:Uncharacterized protein n=1 Tax=Pontibacter aydingkolensis TaxID=1911536 RepID=A0ABS7CP35_9BACT|nr:hypothetical protein [Pontibacter aydingkolensis]MBW7465583.1 hypothetical protein [Pontibacter aydingkolensis]
MLHPSTNKACVRYYYLAPRNGNKAEIIKVLNSHRYTIDVPMWEEDVILEPFYTRPMTVKEEHNCRGAETWKLFSDWSKVCADLLKNGVAENELKELENYRDNLLSSENMVA